MTAIEALIDELTAELCELGRCYESEHSYLIPNTSARMIAIQEALHGPRGLWERRREEIALAAAGGRAVCLGPE